MKKVEIVKKNSKKLYDAMGDPAFISARYTDPGVVYVPQGELRGVKILAKYKIKKTGTYLILE